MKLYALSLSAKTIKPHETKVSSSPAAVVADSEQEAVGYGIEFALEKFPEHDGYQNHFAIAVEIPQRLLDMVKP